MRLEGFLEKMLNIKQAEIFRTQARISLSTVRKDAEERSNPPDFYKAMEKGNADKIGIIAEVKKASPSKGNINIDLNPEFCANAYTNGGASAISVLTESKYFKGSLDDLCLVCENTNLPVLRKDFTIASYQIYEAKKNGASSILLITTILSKDQLYDYISLVRELGMEPLVEISSEKEFEIAYDCEAKIVDINNRNLQTLETDLNVSKRIARILPDDIIPVEASGISSFNDIQAGISAKIYNFLVGESIVRSDDPEKFIKHLRGIEKDSHTIDDY